MSDYAEDLRINKHDLETEWLAQPNHYFHYSSRQADARLEMDQAKEELEQVKADLNLDIRSNPEKYNVPKVTNESVAAAMVMEEDYSKASQALMQARHTHDIITSAVRAFEQRRAALENLVKLRLSQLHSSPKVDAESAEELDKMVSNDTKQQMSEGRRMKRKPRKKD